MLCEEGSAGSEDGAVEVEGRWEGLFEGFNTVEESTLVMQFS